MKEYATCIPKLTFSRVSFRYTVFSCIMGKPRKEREEIQMKKLLAIILAALLALSFAACTSSNERNDTVSDDKSVSAVEENGDETELEELGEFNEEPTIKKTVLVDNDDIKITATKLEYTGYSAELTIEMENKTKGELSVTSGTAGYSANSVNGYMISEYMNCDVPKGKKATDTIEFDYTELNIYGITEIADIELAFTIDDENYNSTYTDPVQIKTSIYKSYDYKTDTFRKAVNSSAIKDAFNVTVKKSAEDELLNKKSVKLSSEVFAVNKDGAACILLEFENNSTKQLDITINDLKVNKIMIQESYAAFDTINPGKRAIVAVEISSEKIENASLTNDSIKEISFTVDVNDQNYNSIISDEEITFSV